MSRSSSTQSALGECEFTCLLGVWRGLLIVAAGYESDDERRRS